MHVSIFRLLIAFVSAVILCLPGYAKDWPGFQGPNRDGTAQYDNLLTDWPEDGPKVLWAIDAAPGFGGAAIVGNTVYTLDREGIKGDILRAIDLNTGKERWSAAYDAPGRLSYDGARSTPTVQRQPESKFAYTVGPLGHVTCFNLAQGKIKWQRHMDDFGAAPPKWGWSQSPLLLGDTVVINPMAKDAGLVALNQDTGEAVWQSKSIGVEGYASPRLIELAGKKQIITFTSTQVTGLDPTNGEILWTYNNIPTKRAIPTPTPIGDSKLFITAGYDAGSALIEISQNDNTFSVKELMRDKDHGGQIHSPLLVNGHLYINLNTNENLRQRGKDAEGLGCFDTNGKLLWKTDNTPDINRGPVLAVNDHLLTVGGEDGVLRLISADPTGYREKQATKVFKADLRRNMIWAPMAFSDGRLILRSQNQLTCIELRKQ